MPADMREPSYAHRDPVQVTRQFGLLNLLQEKRDEMSDIYLGGLAAVGAAIDIGTTEIRTSILDLDQKKRMGTASVRNPQSEFGPDILSRLDAAAGSAHDSETLRKLTVDAISSLLRDLCNKVNIPISSLSRIVIVGNTAMVTLLTGHHQSELLKPGMWGRRIRCELKGREEILRDWGPGTGCSIDIIQPMAGFVGSDLTAGVMATGLTDSDKCSMLIDFGANTEIALWDGRRIWATSAAGGPAFEGQGLSFGMQSGPGAIWHVSLAASGTFCCEVIGGCRPEGICASGLVDIGACLLREGIINPVGRIREDTYPDGAIPVDREVGIMVTASDIDMLSRAKAGVAAAVQCLISRADIHLHDIRRVCISGAFGSYLNIPNARAIGLLPPLPDECMELCGNTALAGCELFLTEPGTRDRASRLSEAVLVLNMACFSGYEEAFAENLLLRPWCVGEHHAA